MFVAFMVAADVAVVATLLAVTRRATLHALLYLAVSLLAVAAVFFTLGAPFVAALEIVVYAGAIVVLFLFAAMLLASGERIGGEGRPTGRAVAGAGLLVLILLAEVVWVVTHDGGAGAAAGGRAVPAAEVGHALFGYYALGVELASMLLLVGLVGVRRLASREAGEEAPPAEETAAPDGEEAAPAPPGDAATAPVGSGEEVQA